MYKEDWAALQQDGTLSQLRVAFSRAGPEKVYVQHLIAEDGAEVAGLIQKEAAFVFVCGDGAQMAKDVHAALASVLAQHGGLSAAEANELLSSMTKEGRYIRDVWC